MFISKIKMYLTIFLLTTAKIDKSYREKKINFKIELQRSYRVAVVYKKLS